MNQQEFHDKILHCCDHKKSFVFTAGEHAYYKSKELSEPKHRKPCRELREQTLIPDPGARR
jgi:hypothetical protein